MATYPQRLQSLGNALVDGVATTGQLTALADAFVAETDDEDIAAKFPGATRETLTDAQKAAIAVEGTISALRVLVKRTRIRAASAAAAQTIANEADVF